MWEIVFSFGYYLKPHIMTQREKILKLNLQINQQLKRAGCLNGKGKIVNPLSNFPDTEWKIWITELIEIRNNIESQLN